MRLSCWCNQWSAEDSADTIDSWVAWSLKALANGCCPDRCPAGKLFSRQYYPELYAEAGTLIAEGWKAVLNGHRGDWSYFKKTYKWSLQV